MAKPTEVYITVRIYTEGIISNPNEWSWYVIEDHIKKNFNKEIRISGERHGKDRHAELVLAQHMVDGVPVVVFKKEK